MDRKILKDAGFSDREIEVYIALLKLGTTTTGPLVKESKVQNAKIYEVLDKLIQKGLATYVYKGKVKYFQPTAPNNILNFFEEKIGMLKETVKELEIIQSTKEPEYEAKVYEGSKAIKSAFWEMYDHIGENAEYCVFPIGEGLGTERLQQFWAEVLRKRDKMRITIRTLPNIKLKPIFLQNYHQYTRFNVRYTTQEFPTGIFIFKDHILNVVWGDKPIAFLIKSKENYQRWKIFFEEQWAKASKD